MNSGAPVAGADLNQVWADFAVELGAIDDLDQLCSFVSRKAASLVSADNCAVFLETRPLKTSSLPVQLTVPLNYRGKELGVLVVERHAQETFNEEDKRRVRFLADITAGAAANLKRVERVQKRHYWRDRALIIMQEIGDAMGSTLEPVPLMRRIISAAVDAVNGKCGALALHNGNNHLELQAVAGNLSQATVGEKIDIKESFMGWVMLHRTPVLVSDSSTDTRRSFMDLYAQEQVTPQSVLAAPLVTKGQSIGAFEVIGKQKDAFDREDLHLLEAIMVPAAAAIENARVHEQLQRHAIQQKNIIRVGQALSAAQDVRVILQEVVESVLWAIPVAQTAAVHLLDTEKQTLYLYCYAGHPLWDTMTQALQVGEGIAGHVFVTRQLMNVSDVVQDLRYVPGPGSIVYRSLLVAPLIVEEKPIGTLSVTGLDSNAFGHDDEQMLHALATQAAVVLRNARLLSSLRESEARYRQLYAQAEERAAELELANRKLQDLARRKTQFVQNTSHELRTPLTLLRGYLEMLKNGEFGLLSIEQEEAVKVTFEKCEELVGLVSDITSLIDMELHPSDIKPVDLIDVVARSVDGMKHRCQRSGIELATTWPQTEVLINGDYRRLMQAFTHLLDNAIKFGPIGGVIQVRLWTEGDHALVQFADQGIGIPPDEKEQIFEQFYQVDGSTTRRFGGTGLGLAIVKETVEAHGGTVSAFSSGVDGEGATFTVRLPIYKESTAGD